MTLVAQFPSRHATGSAVTHIPGFFTGLVPTTPLVADPDHDACPAATRVLLRFADDIGRAVGYDREQSGRLIQDIFPVKSSERAQVSSSSKVMLGSHTETAFHPHKPRYVVLMCLRGDPAAATTYADVDDVVTYLSDDDIAILQTNQFTTTVDPSFMANGEPDATVVVTPLTKRRNDYTFVYDELLMSGTTTRAAHALQSLHHAVRRATRQIVLDSGDLLVIDNDRAVHGRTPFAPRYDGTDRWLKRALVMTALPTTDIIGRVIQTAL